MKVITPHFHFDSNTKKDTLSAIELFIVESISNGCRFNRFCLGADDENSVSEEWLLELPQHGLQCYVSQPVPVKHYSLGLCRQCTHMLIPLCSCQMKCQAAATESRYRCGSVGSPSDLLEHTTVFVDSRENSFGF